MRFNSSRTAAFDFCAKDYRVVVLGNTLLCMREQSLRSSRLHLLHKMLDKMLPMSNVLFQDSFETKQWLRHWTSTHLLLDCVGTNTEAAEVIQKVLYKLELQLSSVIRTYVEWILMRLYISFPGCFNDFWR